MKQLKRQIAWRWNCEIQCRFRCCSRGFLSSAFVDIYQASKQVDIFFSFRPRQSILYGYQFLMMLIAHRLSNSMHTRNDASFLKFSCNDYFYHKKEYFLFLLFEIRSRMIFSCCLCEQHTIISKFAATKVFEWGTFFYAITTY